jgi:hypothetical protein
LLDNFEFIPPVIKFDPTNGGSVQFFKIKPLSKAKPGSYNIVWNKNELSESNKFSEIPDS